MRQNKKFLMPESYAVLTESEMTYTDSGNASRTALTIGCIIGIGASFSNYVWTLSKTREWITNNKGDLNLEQLVRKGLDDTLTYIRSSASNAFIGVFSAFNLIEWTAILLPVTAIVWVTA